MMGIAVVAGYAYPTDFARAERDLRLLRAYRAKLGRVVLLVQSPDRTTHVWEDGGILVHYIPRRGYGLLGLATFWLCGAVTIWRLVRQYGLVAADATDLAAAFVLIPVKRLTGLRMLLHLQFQFLEMPPSAFPRWKRWAFRVGARVACRYADSIRCVTEDIRLQALRAGVDPGRLRVIPTRCDTVLFDPSRVRSRPAGTSRRLVCVGSLTPLKAVHVLLAALPAVLERFPDATLRVVGDGRERAALEQQARQAGLTAAVEFVGALPYSAIPEVLGSSDLFVHPALSEALPRALLEAMAMERPVVASCVGGIPEVIRDGREGLLVPSGDPHALAEAICRILEDPRAGRVMGWRGRRRVLEGFSFDANVQAMVEWHTAWARPA